MGDDDQDFSFNLVMDGKIFNLKSLLEVRAFLQDLQKKGFIFLPGDNNPIPNIQIPASLIYFMINELIAFKELDNSIEELTESLNDFMKDRVISSRAGIINKTDVTLEDLRDALNTFMTNRANKKALEDQL